ncbi:protein rhomboid [Ceratitis capitata]|uniref:protein rhomboid n=1 Tax=Ceratitis capitata TaxID=7213 RepID=UPI000329E0BB|nr:protein rhomboid [Ceratitis capitata]
MTANKFRLEGSNVACDKCDDKRDLSGGNGEIARGSSPCCSAEGSKLLLLANGQAELANTLIADPPLGRWRLPWFLIIISFVQVFVYFIANECMNQRLMLIPGQPYECWRYITYTLLHSDLMHLLSNVSLQCFIGVCLESEQPRWQVALIYAAGGVAGSLVTAYTQPELSLLGASACVYALLTSNVPHLVLNFRQLSIRYLRIVALVILLTSDFGLTLFHYAVNHNVNPRICVQAHIAGGTTGLCLGFLLFYRCKCYSRWRPECCSSNA